MRPERGAWPGRPPDRPTAVAHMAGNELHRLPGAVAAGADVLEADVFYYRGRVEVRHTRRLGALAFWEPWRIEPGWRRPLLLEELLGALPPAAHLMLDLKGWHRALPSSVVRATEAALGDRPYSVCSQAWPLLDAFREQAGVTVVHSIGNEAMLRAVESELVWHDEHAVSIHHRLLSRQRVHALQEWSPTVLTWPVNTVERLREVWAWGVGGVIVDDVDLLARLVADPAAVLGRG